MLTPKQFEEWCSLTDKERGEIIKNGLKKKEEPITKEIVYI